MSTISTIHSYVRQLPTCVGGPDQCSIEVGWILSELQKRGFLAKVNMMHWRWNILVVVSKLFKNAWPIPSMASMVSMILEFEAQRELYSNIELEIR